ncbi:MAG: glycosyltransferase family 1 protein [Candidatus Sericytochromatia bacterium]|nr:glycosyltransferase family 1 protein [Candidatus Sericytochromatia bacterium]
MSELLKPPGRILIGPVYYPTLLGRYAHHPDIKCFYPGMAGIYAFCPLETADLPRDFSFCLPLDLSYQKAPRLQELWEQLPPDWQPDILIWWGLYFPLPDDFDTCPCKRYLIVSDWHPYLPILKRYLPFFDGVFGDRALLELLPGWGYKKAQYWTAYSYAPEDIVGLPDPPPVRDIDIAFVGNLNPRLHSQRSQYLRRLAALSDRYRVVIQPKLYGPLYFKLFQRSRIVFNHSLRGEMNLRAYEAPACGALVMMESDNLEIRDILVPDQECVLYTAENFEDQIHALMADPDRCAAIAARGQQKIQQYCWERQFERLFDLLEPGLSAVALTEPVETPLALRAQYASTTDVRLWHQQMTDHVLAALLRSETTDPLLLNNWLVLRADQSGREVLSPQWLKVIQDAHNPLLPYNLAWFYLMQQDFDRVEAPMLQALLQLSDPAFEMPALAGWLVLPLGYSGLHISWLRYWESPTEQPERQRRHLLAAGLYALCMSHLQLGRYADARQAFAQSVALIADWPEVWQVGAGLLLKLQDLAALVPVLEQVIARGVFYPHAWLLLIELLADAEPERARLLLREARCLFQSDEFAQQHSAFELLSQRLAV